MTSTGSVGSSGADPLHQVEPFLPGGGVARVVEIDDRQVEVRRLDALAAASRGERAATTSNPSSRSSSLQRVEDVGLVVGDQHADGAGFWHF